MRELKYRTKVLANSCLSHKAPITPCTSAAAPRTSLLHNWKSMLACLLISMSPFQYGVDYGLIGGLQAMNGFLQVFGYADPLTPNGWNLTPKVHQLISSLMTLGACAGSLSAGPIGAYKGRRPALWLACILCAASNSIMLGTTTIGGLYAGRFLIGIANGWFMTFSQLYINECSPPHFRGLAMGFFQWWCSVGSMIGTVVDNFTAMIDGRASYMIPLALIYAVPCVLFLGMFFIPESPRWLIEHDKLEAGRKSLEWLRPDKEVIEAEIAEIMAAKQAHASSTAGVTFWDLWKDPVDRRRTLLSIAAISILGASGAMYLISYGTYFFEMANVGSPFMNSCILTAVGVIANMLSWFLVTRVGRRFLVITGIAGSGIVQLIVAIVYTLNPGTSETGKAIVGLSVVYIVFYNGLIGAYAWVLGAEIPSQRLRSMTLGVSACVGFIQGWLAVFTAPYFINPDALNWGPKYGYIWFPSCTITAIVTWWVMPETKDRTLEELDEMFALRLPARKFKNHICTGNIPGRERAETSENGLSSPIDEKSQEIEYIETANKA
ncbi:general substrate transporter [Dacryopinax primogenitus]|uniref:General substrate transporter n=1 Tax=Dacryopinax primogenitus (strain DJM 731) TaxID=1858805 RepID=M5GAP6_DACPD|nr:general substrate transporter [Dacryopinax primogenitus]EJU05944.1 general substrate transporter [Dacryopinax primogenitus]